MGTRPNVNKYIVAGLVSFTVVAEVLSFNKITAYGEDVDAVSAATENSGEKTGGGYSVTNQVEGVGYAFELYDASNGLPTSDANCIYADKDGYIWVGSYSGVMRYDGNNFERLDSSKGLANGKAIFEDSKGHMWIGTNDNGVVRIDTDGTQTHYTYKDGLPASTIRSFAEDEQGTVYIGTTSGICYVDDNFNIQTIENSDLINKYILRLTSDTNGLIYVNTREGDLFVLDNAKIRKDYKGEELGIDKITSAYADQETPGSVYIGTSDGYLYYGSIDDDFENLEKIDVTETVNVNWIDKASGRIWVIGENAIGFLDENRIFKKVENLPVNSGVEMLTEDYQGNVWFASTRQGVAKIVTTNYQDVTGVAGLGNDVVNTTCLKDGDIYIGTDRGLKIVNENFEQIENELTTYLAETRIRCITKDDKDNLWIATYTNEHGLVKYSSNGQITEFNQENGLISNYVRCITIGNDGSILVGTTAGLVIIKDDQLIKVYGEEEGLENTVILTIEQSESGDIFLGTDGGGMYVITDGSMKKYGREEGLTSDVILRVKKDVERELLWIITSNSIEYFKDDMITEVKHFPYNNNFDIFYDSHDNVWILASYGIFCVKAEDMLSGQNFDYKLYDKANGLPSVPTGNSFSAIDEQGNLFISGRSGVSRVNINNYYNQYSEVKVDLKSLICDDEEIKPNEDGTYVIPATPGRIQINAAVLNYTLSNPTIRIYLEGAKDEGIMMPQSKLKALEYTGLEYGNYILHIQVVNGDTGEVWQDESFEVEKKPTLYELRSVRIMALLIVLLVVGFLVWRIMTSTIIRHQYAEIKLAKEEAERANIAKTSFLANMTHEIRTPINTILGVDELMLREQANDVPKKYFMTMTNYALDIKIASETLLGIVNDILDLSKVESGKMHILEQEYDVEEQLRSILAMIKGRADEKGLAFEVDFDEKLPKKMYGDNSKIKQVVVNLLSNAVKYTQEGGVIFSVKILDENDDRCTIKFAVKDTGIGVKQEDMEKIFSAFERVDEEKNSGIQGTGLGLDISRQIAELMKGSLTCESVYGEGSEFIFVLEQRVTDSTPIGKFPAEPAKISAGPYKPLFIAPDAEILVVDDDQMSLVVVKNLLKATKMFITTATSGEECLEKIKYGDFNVVLLDHMMSGMDGVETVARIRETHPDLPVYCMTANEGVYTNEYYIEKGFNGYIPKPIDGTELEKAIRKFLPDSLVEDLEVEEATNEIPEEYLWLNNLEGIHTEMGMVNSGGFEGFLFALTMFLETIDENSDALKEAVESGDLKFYTRKIHGLKTSARIIGAKKLADMAEKLEEAGKIGDWQYIYANHVHCMSLYLSYEEHLRPLMSSQVDN